MSFGVIWLSTIFYMLIGSVSGLIFRDLGWTRDEAIALGTLWPIWLVGYLFIRAYRFGKALITGSIKIITDR